MLAGWRIEIVATDLSMEILDKAKEGLYSQFEVQRGLPVNLLVKYFKKHGDRWQIDAEIRQIVKYQKFNLLSSPSALGKFDVIFCRNVLIYFDPPTKTEVFTRLADVLVDDGFFYLGGAETVLRMSYRFALMPGHRGIYRLASNEQEKVAS